MPSPAVASFRLALELDITGSMGSQLKACKEMLSKLVLLVEEEAAKGVEMEIVVIPFTEMNATPKGHATGCLASLHQFSNPKEASAFISKLQLCRSPLAPKVSASGEDGPENQKAALNLLEDLDPMPTISFLVTDASPHLHGNGNRSQTHTHELNWLAQREVEESVRKDAFKLFKHLTDHYDGLLIANMVIFNGACPKVYGRFAQSTGGMLMQPTSNDASRLSKSLLTVVRCLLARMSGRAAPVSSLPDMSLYDVDELEPCESEEDLNDVPPPKVGENEVIFNSAMERATAVVTGKKWAKRAMGMTAAVEQMRFVWLSARYLTQDADKRTPEAFAEIVALLLTIKEALPEVQKGHVSLKVADLEEKLKDPSIFLSNVDKYGDASESIITLETVGEALEEDADTDDWLKSVMRLLIGFPVHLQMPLDAMGKPDFMDSWASVCERMGNDKMFASDFARLIGEVEEGVVMGPTDRLSYNSFLAVVPSPKDTLARLVFWLMSGTQLLNCIQGVTMGAKGFIPNLYAGTCAGALTKLISSPGKVTDVKWERMTQLMYTLRQLHRNPARDVTKKLAAGIANPSDLMSKFVVALARMYDKPCFKHAFRLVMEEWAAFLLQRHYKKRTPETNAAYLKDVLTYCPIDDVIPGGMECDPLSGYHFLEQEAAVDKKQMYKGWEQRVIEKLRAHPVYQTYVSNIQKVLAVLESGAYSRENMHSTDVSIYWPEWEKGFLQLFLLRMRKERYTTSTKEEGVTEFEAVNVNSNEDLLVKRYQSAKTEVLNGWKQARKDYCREELLKHTVNVLRRVKKDTPDKNIVNVLSTLYTTLTVSTPSTPQLSSPSGIEEEEIEPMEDAATITKRPKQLTPGPTACLLGNHYAQLTRLDVPDILRGFKKVQKREQMVRALLFGNWSTSPPQSLKRVRKEIVDMLESESLIEEVETALRSQFVCTRKELYNRHGHRADLTYPGPLGWTTLYEAKRLRVKPGKRKYVEMMKKYTIFGQLALATAKETGISHQRTTRVNELLGKWEDANMYEPMREKVETVLGVEVDMDAMR